MSCDFYMCDSVCFYVSMAFTQLINECCLNIVFMVY